MITQNPDRITELSEQSHALEADRRLESSETSLTNESQPSGLEFSIDPWRVFRSLALLIAVMVVVGTAARIVIYQVAPTPDHPLARVMKRFDLGHEPSIPAWYSSLALLCSAGLLAVIALAITRRKQPFAFHWWALSGLFVLLAIDEAVMFHEMADTFTRNLLNTRGLLHFAWVIPGAAFVLAVGLFFLKFVWHLEQRTRWLFVASGCIFVGGAIGIELIEGVIAEGAGIESLQLTFAQAVEEGCEMIGIALFIYALLDFIGRRVGPVRLNVATHTSAGTP